MRKGRSEKPILKYSLIGSIALLFLLLFYTAYLGTKVESLTQQLSYEKNLNQTLQEEITHLNRSLIEINQELAETRGKLRYCEWRSEELEANLQSTLDELNVVRSSAERLVDIAEKVTTWIAGNSELNGLEWEAYIEPCVRGSAEGDVLNLPCIPWYNDFTYRPDMGDRISPVWEFLLEGGGDCEDYSLFMAAAVRTAIRKGLRVRVAKEGEGRFWLNRDWYYSNAEPVDIDARDVSVYCGSEEESNTGHCIIVIVDKEGRKYFVEPQDGFLYPDDPFSERDLVLTADDYIDLEENLSLKEALERVEEVLRSSER